MNASIKKNEFTGERFIPELFSSGSEIYDAHTLRYEFALDFVKNKTVLDVSSGDGYGSFAMAQNAHCVYGVDKDPEAITIASNKYIKNNLYFSTGNAESLEFPENFFDVVVSFETIEHLDSQEQRSFLNCVKNILKEDGIFIISTPDKDIYGFDHNEFHKAELNKMEFINMLGNLFSVLAIYGQDVKYRRGSILTHIRFLVDKIKKSHLWKMVKHVIPWSFRDYVNNITNRYNIDQVQSSSKEYGMGNQYALQELGENISAKYIIAVCKKKLIE